MASVLGISRRSGLRATPISFPEERALSHHHDQQRKPTRIAQAGQKSPGPRCRASQYPREGNPATVPRQSELEWGHENASIHRFEDLRRLWFSVVSRNRWRKGVLQILRGEAGGISQSTHQAPTGGTTESPGKGIRARADGHWR